MGRRGGGGGQGRVGLEMSSGDSYKQQRPTQTKQTRAQEPMVGILERSLAQPIHLPYKSSKCQPFPLKITRKKIKQPRGVGLCLQRTPNISLRFYNSPRRIHKLSFILFWHEWHFPSQKWKKRRISSNVSKTTEIKIENDDNINILYSFYLTQTLATTL